MNTAATPFDTVVDRCLAASQEDDPRRAIREALDAIIADRVLDAVDGGTPGLTTLYNTDELTVLNVVWPPLVRLFPHDHKMWAAIAIYGGQEDNAFYRRTPEGLVPSGGKELRDGDVVLLGADTIHAVTNPARTYTGAIHVYGGNFFRKDRSQWDAATLAEQPFDQSSLERCFAEADAAFRASTG